MLDDIILNYSEHPSVSIIDEFITRNAMKLKPNGARRDWTEELVFLRERIRFFNTDKLTHVRGIIEGKSNWNDVINEVYKDEKRR